MRFSRDKRRSILTKRRLYLAPGATTQSICKQAAMGPVVHVRQKERIPLGARDSSRRKQKRACISTVHYSDCRGVSAPDEVSFHTYCMTLSQRSIGRKYRELRQRFLPCFRRIEHLYEKSLREHAFVRVRPWTKVLSWIKEIVICFLSITTKLYLREESTQLIIKNAKRNLLKI